MNQVNHFFRALSIVSTIMSTEGVDGEPLLKPSEQWFGSNEFTNHMALFLVFGQILLECIVRHTDCR